MQGYKPDPVLFRVFVIYLLDLPSEIGRAALNPRYTWSFSPQGLPDPVELLQLMVVSYTTFSPLPVAIGPLEV